jgi:hypothetical protein
VVVLVVVAFFILLASTPTIALVGLLLWSRWLARRTAAPRFVTWPAYALLALGVAVTVTGPVAGGLRSLAAIVDGRRDPQFSEKPDA